MNKNKEDSSDEEGLREFHIDQADAAQDIEDSFASSISSKRGRTRIPEQWTKVISLDQDDLEKIKMHVLANDLKLMTNLPLTSTTRKRDEWKPHFFSKAFLKANPRPTLEKFQLKEFKLKQLGIMVSKCRARFRAEAEKAQRQVGADAE